VGDWGKMGLNEHSKGEMEVTKQKKKCTKAGTFKTCFNKQLTWWI
jgi:hypothetical protein